MDLSNMDATRIELYKKQLQSDVEAARKQRDTLRNQLAVHLIEWVAPTAGVGTPSLAPRGSSASSTSSMEELLLLLSVSFSLLLALVH